MRPMDLEIDSVPSLESSGIVYDAAIVYSSEDAEEAKQVMDMMNNIDLGHGRKPDVCLYDHPLFSPSKVKKMCCVVKNCSFIFVLLTENCKGDSSFDLFLEEAIGITRLETCGNCGTPPTSVQKKYFSVRPLHTQLKGTRSYGIPLGLTTIEGFCLKKASIVEELKEFFNCFKNEKCLPKDSLKTLSLPASEGTSSAKPISETSVPENSVYAVADPTHVTSFGEDINKESALIQEKIETEDYGWIPDDKDRGYTESELTYYSNSASNYSSIAIAQKNKDLMVQGPPQNRSGPKPNSQSYFDMIENGRLESYGNSRGSSRTLLDSAPFLTTMSKKTSRKPKGKKVVNRLIGCNFLQVGCSSRSHGNPYGGTLSVQDNQDDSDTEWSNEDPVTLVSKSKKGSDTQDSTEQTVVPSNSTETFRLDYHNDNAKTTIEESADGLQGSSLTERADSATSSHIYHKGVDQRSASSIAVHYSNEYNSEDHQQPEHYSTCPSLRSVDAVKHLDSQDPLQQCSYSQDPLLHGSERQDPLLQSSGSQDPLLQGSESQDPLLQGSESQDPFQLCSESQDPLQQVSESQDPLLQGSESQDLLLQVSESQDPLLQVSESQDPLLHGSGSQDPLLPGSESQDPLLQSSESRNLLLQGSESRDLLLQGSESQDALLQDSGSQDPMQLASEREEPWKCQESLPGEDSVSSPNQPQDQEESICQKVLSREEPLSMGSIRRECFEDADGTRVPLIINQDQLGFNRPEENHLHRFSQPETFPFSYHSLHSNRLADRQMSFVTIAKLSSLFNTAPDDLD